MYKLDLTGYRVDFELTMVWFVTPNHLTDVLVTTLVMLCENNYATSAICSSDVHIFESQNNKKHNLTYNERAYTLILKFALIAVFFFIIESVQEKKEIGKSHLV